MRDTSSKVSSISPLRLQIVEIVLAVLAFYLAVHLTSTLSIVLVVAGIVIGALVLITSGPIGVVHKMTPVANVIALGCTGVLMMLAPIALHRARSTEAFVVLEGGGLLIGLTILSVARGSRATPAAAPPVRSETPVRPSSFPSVGTGASLRAAGRMTGRARGVVAGQAPIVARRAGRFIGSRRKRP